jgi:peptide/nickel transport system permease protein
MRIRFPISVGPLVLVAVILCTCIILPGLLSVHAPRATETEQFEPPSPSHVLGTDQFGRDVLSRLILGGRNSLISATLAATVAISLGTALGAGAVALGKRIDNVIMRLVDVMLAFPGLLLAMIFVAALGPGLLAAILGTGISLAPGVCRFVRASLLALRQQPFLEAATALGASRLYVIRKHLIPNIAVELAGYSAVVFAWSLLNISGLEFLGLAGPPDSISWGRILYEGRSYLANSPWIALSAGCAIVVTTLLVMQLSDMLTGNEADR